METLSDKIYGGTYSEIDRISVEDVKEFIKQLKEEIKITLEAKHKTKAQWIYRSLLATINYKIDKLAGEKLI